jgi:hypothetical protein
VAQLTDEEFDRIYGPWAAPTPAEMPTLLAGFDRPWWVGSGWAAELYSGVPRRHHDLDLIVLRRDFDVLRAHLAGYDWSLAHAGVLTPLPTTEPLPDDRHQVWLRRSPDEPWLLDVLVSPADGDTWVCRRNSSIRLPLSEVGLRTSDGIPYLRPEIVLLFKAVHLEARDAADFEALLPVLDERARQWLVESMRATYPDHEWIARLDR